MTNGAPKKIMIVLSVAEGRVAASFTGLPFCVR
jgi:hypothetical protein